MKEVQVIRPTIGEEAGKLLRVAAYCRVSTDSDDQINSFIAQVKYYNDFIRRSENMTLVDIYADEGITGTCVNKRDEFLRMMSDSKKGKIDRVLVKSVSRFARNSLECIENIRLLKSYGTTVLFENDGIDTEKMNSEMILYIKSAFAQSEALAGSKRVSTAYRMKMENGEFITYTAPFGYKIEDGVLVPIEEYKEIVNRIFTDYLSGIGKGRIAERLNKEQCANREWSVTMIGYILSNEKYVGDSLLQKTYTPEILPLKSKVNHGERDMFYVSGTHEGIVPREIFDAVQRKRNEFKGNKRNSSAKSIFSDLIFCGDCGWKFKKKVQSGKTYWVCSKDGISGYRCSSVNVSEESLKKAFVALFNKLKQNQDELVDYTINQLVSLKTKVAGNNREINEIDAEIASLCSQNSMLSRYKIKGIIDDVSFLEQTSELQKQLTALRNRRKKIINDDDNEQCIDKLRELKESLESISEGMMFFDEEIFLNIIERILVFHDGALVFELKCGLKLREII